MDYRPNSGTDAPVFQVEIIERSLAERYKSLVQWDGPKHPSISTYEARLQSFGKGWPHRHHNAKLFSAADFFTLVLI
jgi:hypothetical protein